MELIHATADPPDVGKLQLGAKVIIRACHAVRLLDLQAEYAPPWTDYKFKPRYTLEEDPVLYYFELSAFYTHKAADPNLHYCHVTSFQLLAQNYRSIASTIKKIQIEKEAIKTKSPYYYYHLAETKLRNWWLDKVYHKTIHPPPPFTPKKQFA